MNPCGLGKPSCTVKGTLPARPRSVTYSRHPRDRYSISSASVFRAWWMSQSMMGPEYMACVWSPYILFTEGQGRTAIRPCLDELVQRFDLTGADLVGDCVVQDLERRV